MTKMNRISGKIDTKILVGVLVALTLVVGIAAVVRLDVLGKKGGGLGKDFKYDVREMAYIDPNLILYEESGRVIETGFAEARAIAVDSTGSLYVAGDTAIRIFAPSGDLLGEIKLAGTPTCLTVVEDGTVYVGLQDHVEVYDPRGQRQARWDDLGQDAILTSIAVLRGNVLVADAGNRVVVRYDLSGKVLNYIGEKDPERNVPGFVIPSPYFDLAVPRDGLLRVVNTGRRRIESYTLDGDFEFWWGESSAAVEGFCGCCNPVNIAVLPKGGFVTCEKGLIRVKVYDSEGGFVGVVAGPAQLGVETDQGVCELPGACQSGGFDVAVDAGGRVFVLDTIRNLVRMFTAVKGR
jgi:hypothetical protein